MKPSQGLEPGSIPGWRIFFPKKIELSYQNYLNAVSIKFNMFKKRQCSKCGRKIEGKYSFCPYCGNRFDSNKEDNDDWGMLGKNDFMPSANEIKLPMGLNAIFNSLMKNMSKELNEQLSRNNFQTEEKQPKKIKKDGISISISTFGNGPPKIKVTQLGEKPKLEIEEEKEKLKPNTFTKEKIKKLASLERKEPKTNIRRLSNRVVYELEMPGVESLEDISIIKLENSIEIKAISKNKAYIKIIPINLPITNYNLSEGKLVLELGIKN
jgi:HSP20 family molecular chaperone IbpA